MSIRALATFAALLAGGLVSIARADDSPQLVSQISMTPETADGSTWVLVAPYGWLPGVRGDVGAGGATANVDVSVGDVIESLDDLNGAVMGHVEVGRNRWGLIFDGMLIKLEPERTLPSGDRVTVQISSTLLESLAMLRVVETEDTNLALPRMRIDALGGARYYQVMTGVRVNPAAGPVVARELTKDWVDILVGGRAAVTVLDGLEGFLRADFGGFGIGTSSDLAWNLIAGGEYACPSLPGSSMILGYRVLSIDEKQKTGPNEFVYDVTMQGPFAAFAFRF